MTVVCAIAMPPLARLSVSRAAPMILMSLSTKALPEKEKPKSQKIVPVRTIWRKLGIQALV
jgi:hypothetical protein